MWAKEAARRLYLIMKLELKSPRGVDRKFEKDTFGNMEYLPPFSLYVVHSFIPFWHFVSSQDQKGLS
jgi:hypothetical protein